MDQNKYIKFFRIFVVVALVISLLTNFGLLTKLDELENQVQTLGHVQEDILRNVNDQTNRIQSEINDMREEQSWISKIEMEVDEEKMTGGQSEAAFNWQVKEMPRDGEVIFNYSLGEDEDEEFISVPAEELEQGVFRAQVPFDIELEPMWNNTILNSNTNSLEEMSKREYEERRNQHTIQYFVSVSSDESLKSSDIHTEDLGHFGSRQYGSIQTDIDLYEDMVNITLFQHKVNESSVEVDEAYLLKYEDETLVEEEEMVVTDEHESDPMTRLFHLNEIEASEEMQLVIRVVYSNGDEFERVVFNHN
ncbi:hypothetical protein SAMN05216389_11844 [Oceanobacillus limi]|uniref:Uncharacterized protein n=1 Tax=Oceanobacillus limi TaxID=930131 RepID=A0A1I0G0W3_9BACI|nr:hypothetical protein [Oceanobacillus limi]SET64358.1 hypothetical protein SAMN05216389_11844 [Oceanobacillus limi]